MLVTSRSTCRACDGALDSVLDLGTLALSAFPTDGTDLPRAPLHLVQCVRCGLVQLAHTVDPESLYTEYWYRSGINETMRAELADIVHQALATRPVRPDREVVLDVGANDGTLLSHYEGVNRIAVEPAANLQADLRPHAEIRREGFFPGDGSIARQFAGQVAILTSIACFYDVEDPHAFVAAVADCLAPKGIWIVQFQDLAQMITATAFDNLCHEHLIYYSLGAIERLVAAHGLQVIHAERRAINGGSLRLILGRRAEWMPDATVDACRLRDGRCEQWEQLAHFAWRVGAFAGQIRAAVHALQARQPLGAIDLYGASTKANTLLQVCALGPPLLRQAWERSAAKWGRATVTGIPIVSEAEGRRDPPAALLCGIWQFRDAILRREADYLAQGGQILFPLPQLDVVTGVRA